MTDERKNEIWAMLPADFKELVTKTYQIGVPYDAFRYDRRAPEYRRQAEGGLYMLEFLFGTHNLTAQAEEKPNEPRFKVGDKVIYGPANVKGTITRLCKGIIGEFLYDIENSYARYSNCFECDLAPYTEPNDQNEESKYSVGDKVFVKTSRNLCSKDIDIFRRNPSYVQGIKDGMVTVAVSMQHSATIPIEDIVPWVDGDPYIKSEAPTTLPPKPTENDISDSKIQPESAESVETSTKEDAYFAYRLDLAKEIAVAMIAANWEAADIPHDAVEDANEIVKRLKETENAY